MSRHCTALRHSCIRCPYTAIRFTAEARLESLMSGALRALLLHTLQLSMLGHEANESLGDFPHSAKIWASGDYSFMGSGIKYRTILFVKIQLYAVALYVEENEATKELQRLEKEGSLGDHSVDSMCAALASGSFKKFLQIQLLRDVSLSQFTGEIGRDLKPRLDATGDPQLWQQFEDYFRGKDLSKGSNLLGLIQEGGEFEGGLFPPSFTDFQHAKPSLFFTTPKFGAALLDVYLGHGGIVPDARNEWARSAQNLLNEGSQQSAVQ